MIVYIFIIIIIMEALISQWWDKNVIIVHWHSILNYFKNFLFLLILSVKKSLHAGYSWCYILYFIYQHHNLTVSIICKFRSLEAFQSTEPGLKTNFYSYVNLNMNVIRRLSKDHNGWMPGWSISFYTFIHIERANFEWILKLAKIKID